MNHTINSFGSAPPDPTGAIGPSYYVEFVNAGVGVYDRNLVSQSVVSEDKFTGSSGVCDGQIKWDQAAQRFEYWSLDCGGGANGFSFGWSKTSSPLPLNGRSANWCKYHVNTGTLLEDYGKLGNDNNFLIIGADEFDDTGNYTDSPFFVAPKPANGVTSCPGSLSLQKFTPPADDIFAPEPANIFDSSSTGYIVGADFNTDDVHVYQVSGSGTATVTDLGDVGVAPYDTPASVPQPHSDDVIDSGSGVLTQAVAAYDPAIGGIGIWTQHTVAGNGGGPSVVRWYEISPGNGTPHVVQSGTVAVANTFVFNAAISPTASGDAAAIEYNLGGTATLVQVWGAIHPRGSSAGSMSGQTKLASSAGVDADFTCPSRNQGAGDSCRWGDYSGASPDPASSCGAVWGTNEINAAPKGSGDAQWLTQNFSLSPNSCPSIGSLSPSSGSIGAAVTITGSGFTGATSVKFNGTNAQSFTVNSDSSISATVGAGTTNGQVTVTGPGGTGTSSGQFTVTYTLALSVGDGGSVKSSPSGIKCGVTCTASFAAGTVVTLTASASRGDIFVGWAGSCVGATATCQVTMSQDRSVTATFVVPPVISSFSPGKGPVGKVVTIIGSGFVGVTAVKFHGVNAQTFTVNSSAKITATVAAGTTSGTITVTEPNGVATSGKSFTVTAR